MSGLELGTLRGVAVLVAGGGLGVACACMLTAHARQVRAALRAYQARLASELRFMRWPVSARLWLVVQGLLLVAVLLALGTGLWLVAGVCALACALAWPYLQLQRARRVTALDEQLDDWLSGLASSLRATPSLGDALEQSLALVAPPLRDELDQTLKEYRLGVALDEALGRMGARVRSRTLVSVLGAIRIGRNTGGQLSEILERSAATLREMARLEGVIRTKTAEGKAQAVVMGVMPGPLVAMLHYLNPNLLAPLTRSLVGYGVIAAAVCLFLGAAVAAWKILDVDI